MSRKILSLFYIAITCTFTFTSCKDIPKQQEMKPLPISDFLLGHYAAESHPDFIEIECQYADRPGLYMQKEAYEAFLAMAAAGEKDGVSFCILSATRSFDYQKMLWENKWNGIFTIDGNVKANEAYPDEMARAKKILEYSAMPGTSRHHWGTDIDINALSNDYFNKEGKPWYEWMKKNASQYGFYQPYTKKGTHRKFGYEEEKWHWTYLPLARNFTHLIQTHIQDTMISGFAGDQFTDTLDVVNNFILGIDPSCL